MWAASGFTSGFQLLAHKTWGPHSGRRTEGRCRRSAGVGTHSPCVKSSRPHAGKRNRLFENGEIFPDSASGLHTRSRGCEHGGQGPCRAVGRLVCTHCERHQKLSGRKEWRWEWEFSVPGPAAQLGRPPGRGGSRGLPTSGLRSEKMAPPCP